MWIMPCKGLYMKKDKSFITSWILNTRVSLAAEKDKRWRRSGRWNPQSTIERRRRCIYFFGFFRSICFWFCLLEMVFLHENIDLLIGLLPAGNTNLRLGGSMPTIGTISSWRIMVGHCFSSSFNKNLNNWCFERIYAAILHG